MAHTKVLKQFINKLCRQIIGTSDTCLYVVEIICEIVYLFYFMLKRLFYAKEKGIVLPKHLTPAKADS